MNVFFLYQTFNYSVPTIFRYVQVSVCMFLFLKNHLKLKPTFCFMFQIIIRASDVTNFTKINTHYDDMNVTNAIRSHNLSVKLV